MKVTYKNLDFGFELEDTFDTVILAVGRDAQTQDLVGSSFMFFFFFF